MSVPNLVRSQWELRALNLAIKAQIVHRDLK